MSLRSVLGAAAVVSVMFAAIEVSSAQTLEGDVSAVNGFTGGTQVLTLDGGPQAAGERYLVLGSVS
ncbi:MAG: hypothetical protein AAFX85_07425, partial [Pseudomonadota bacterium]